MRDILEGNLVIIASAFGVVTEVFYESGLPLFWIVRWLIQKVVGGIMPAQLYSNRFGNLSELKRLLGLCFLREFAVFVALIS